jgi:hypothetical protein
LELNTRECDLVIRALTKVLETEPSYARADEYKKLLDRLQVEQEMKHEELLDGFQYDYH